MGTATEQIRVSDTVKRELKRRMRDGESFNDVLERILGETSAADFDDGFGMLSDDQADVIREGREQAKQEWTERRRLADKNT